MSVGFPENIKLHEFGSKLWDVFGVPAYHVGSSVDSNGATKREWFDVDVVVILDDKEWEKWGFGAPENQELNPKWVAMCWAFSMLGRDMTGLKIDFKIQQQSWANKHHRGAGKIRSALVMIPWRHARFHEEKREGEWKT